MARTEARVAATWCKGTDARSIHLLRSAIAVSDTQGEKVMVLKTWIILAALILCSPAGAQQKSADQRALDAAVISAITRGDMNHARRLAVTAEHWHWIDGAQREGAQRSTPRADARDEARSSQACADAQRRHRIEAGRIKKNRAAIDATRQAARSACGSLWY